MAKRSEKVAALYERFLRKPPQQSRSKTLVDAVLRAATELVAKQDEEALTIQDVADRAGVGVGSLYDYFRDRRSILSGLAAKLTQENLGRFEAELSVTQELPLEEAVSRITALLVGTYLEDVRIPRAVLRIAHRTGLMPTLAESQATFARALASWLRRRSDVRVADVDAAAWMITNMAMGAVHAFIWSESPEISVEQLRTELVRAIVAYLERA